MQGIDFWFSIGSTYSYLTVMRLEDTASRHGVDITWRPFDVRHVMIAQQNIPFKGKPVKTAYMWRDIARRAPVYGLSPMLPAPYPCPELPLANQVATLAALEGWVEAYTRATYQRWFEHGQPIGENPNLSQSLTEIGQDPTRVIAEARTAIVTDTMAANTEQAMALGVFGSPSFVVGQEMFWGDDRLEDAIAWAKAGQLT